MIRCSPRVARFFWLTAIALVFCLLLPPMALAEATGGNPYYIMGFVGTRVFGEPEYRHYGVNASLKTNFNVLADMKVTSLWMKYDDNDYLEAGWLLSKFYYISTPARFVAWERQGYTDGQKHLFYNYMSWSTWYYFEINNMEKSSSTGPWRWGVNMGGQYYSMDMNFRSASVRGGAERGSTSDGNISDFMNLQWENVSSSWYMWDVWGYYDQDPFSNGDGWVPDYHKHSSFSGKRDASVY